MQNGKDRVEGDPRVQSTLTFASYNIHKCVGIDRRFDPGRIAAVIAELDADVLALQEADRRFGDRAGLLDLDVLTQDTGLEPVALPEPQRGLAHGWHGNLILVRRPLSHAARSITLPGLEPRGAVVADIDLACGAVRVVAAHLGLLRHSRLLQVAALVKHARAEAERPVVLLGDLNEWRQQRRSALNGFTPVFGPLGQGVPSFPSYFPVLALDRIFAQPQEMIESLEAHDSPLARVASDHLPVKARVRLDCKILAGEAALAERLPMRDHGTIEERRRALGRFRRRIRLRRATAGAP